MIRLVTGGVRSGKSQFAESLCHQGEKNVIYIATGQAIDLEMEERIRQHQQRRPISWGLIEEPLDLAKRIEELPLEPVLLLDSITTWVANQMLHFSKAENWTKEMKRMFFQQMQTETDLLLQTLQHHDAIIVTDEVGLGGVSVHPITRLFQDTLGRMNQQIAESAEEVWMVISGIPWRIKG